MKNTIVKTYNLIKSILIPTAQDKAKHQMVGIYLVALIIALSEYINYWLAIPVLFVVAFGYEAYQKVFKKGVPELMDAVRTVVGGLIVLFWYFVYCKL